MARFQSTLCLLLFAIMGGTRAALTGQDGQNCTLETFAAQTARVNAACCPPDAGCASTVNALPRTCAARPRRRLPAHVCLAFADSITRLP